MCHHVNIFFLAQQLLGHKHTRLLGLVYLRTASEELATPREDLPMHRKTELFRLLSSQVPLTLDTLTGTIDIVVVGNL